MLENIREKHKTKACKKEICQKTYEKNIWKKHSRKQTQHMRKTYEKKHATKNI